MMPASEAGAVALGVPWQVLRDLIIGVVLAGGLWLLSRQNRFLRDRVDVLVQGQQALQAEAAALKTHTERFLAVLAELSPEKFLQRLKATEALLEKHAEAKVAEVEREAKGRLAAAVAEKEILEQMSRERATELFGKLGSTTAVLALTLYELPRNQRSILLARMRDEDQKKIVTELVAEIERAQGPSPAELISGGLGFVRLRPHMLERPTDVTPGTPAKPMGESLTSP